VHDGALAGIFGTIDEIGKLGSGGAGSELNGHIVQIVHFVQLVFKCNSRFQNVSRWMNVELLQEGGAALDFCRPLYYGVCHPRVPIVPAKLNQQVSSLPIK
jgi:hypothetical protein